MNVEYNPLELFLPKERFLGITRHLMRKDIEAEEIKKDQDYIKKRREESTKMVEQWPDSIENIRHREAERREIKIKQREEAYAVEAEFYKEFHKEERKELLEKARRKYSITNRPNLALSKALLEAQIYAENDAILKLKSEMHQNELAREKEWVDRVIEDVENFKKEQAQKKCKVREKAKLYQAYQLEQIKEKQERECNQLSLQQGREELENLARTDREIKEIQEEDSFNRFKDMKKMMKNHYENKQKQKDAEENEDHELSSVTKLYNNHYTRRHCKIEKQYKDNIKKSMEDRRKSGLKFRENVKVRDDNICYLNGLAKIEKTYQERKEEESINKERMINDRIQDYNEDKQKKNDEKTRKHELMKYQLGERWKATEVMKKYDLEKQKQLRKNNIEHIEKMNEYSKERRETDEKPTVDIHKMQDEKFFTYAKEVLDYTKQRGRSVYPIKREISIYCKQNYLPVHELCHSQKETE